MAKKDFRQSASDPLGSDSSSLGSSWVQTDSQIFGELASVDAQITRIQPISIFEIVPNPTQPRRAIPSNVKSAWDGTPVGIAEIFTEWWKATLEERNGQPFDLDAYMEQGLTERAEDSNHLSPGPIESGFLAVIDLATSIRRDGLTNPITMVAQNGLYMLETGERRWLAYHLLYAWFNGDDEHPDERDTWSKIPARVVENIDVWRQASENNSRADLNAIGKARQWAVLMMSLHNNENCQPFEDFHSEREYYAQAADLRPPYGKGEQLMNAMGVSGRSALSRYRALLKLPDEIWQGGDDLNLAEELLYDLAVIAKRDPRQALAQYQDMNNVPARNNVGKKPQTKTTGEKVFTPGSTRHFSRMVNSVSKSGRGKYKHNAQALKTLRELRDWLESEEERIMNYMD
jgi:hypothetical protein